MRFVGSEDVKIDFEKRCGFEQSDRVAQSAKRRSRCAAADTDQRFARSARTKYSCRGRECFDIRNRPCIHPAICGKRNGILEFCSGEMSASAPNWRSQIRRGLDLFDLKGALESVVPNVSFRPGKFPDFAIAVEIWFGDQRVGFGGQLLAGKSSASSSVLVAELNADLLLDKGGSAKKFRELDRYPVDHPRHRHDCSGEIDAR